MKGEVRISLTKDYEKVSVISEENNWFSFIWVAKRKSDHKLFFVKSFDISKFEGDSHAKELFKQEIYEQIKLWSSCFHQSLMTLYGYEEQENIISCISDHMDVSVDSYVMELSPGKNLENFIFRLFETVSEGTYYLKREKNFLHKNISPKNIFYCRKTNQIKMIDFFFGEKLMTQLYMRRESQYDAPEIIKNLGAKNFYHQSINEKSDVFSLGLSLLNLLTWRESSKYKGANKDPKIRETMLSTLKTSIPNELSDILTEMVQENPDRRPTCEILFGVSKLLKEITKLREIEQKRPHSEGK